MSKVLRIVPSAAIIALVAVLSASAADQPPWPDLSQPPPEEGGGSHDAALIVGITDYVDVPDVPGAVTNADDWYAWLKRTRGLPLGSAVVLRNRDATRETILMEAALAAERVKAGGTLWFVFIGHGAPSRSGNDGLMLGRDVQQTAASVYARGVAQSELLEVLAQGEQEHTIAVLDTCFSGRGSYGDALVNGLQPLVPNYGTQSAEATLLTAGSGDEFSGPLPGVARPAFSYLVLGALRGWGDLDSNGSVTAIEAVDYARGALVELVRDRRQTPQIHGAESDIVLSHGREGGPDLAAMVLVGSVPSGGSPLRDVSTDVGSNIDLTAAAAEADRLQNPECELR